MLVIRQWDGGPEIHFSIPECIFGAELLDSGSEHDRYFFLGLRNNHSETSEVLVWIELGQRLNGSGSVNPDAKEQLLFHYGLAAGVIFFGM